LPAFAEGSAAPSTGTSSLKARLLVCCVFSALCILQNYFFRDELFALRKIPCSIQLFNLIHCVNILYKRTVTFFI